MNKDRENRYKMSRVTAGITQEKASELLAVSPRTLSDYENGHTKVPDDVVAAMAEVYNCPLLAWWHLKHNSVLGKFLPDIQMPQSNGDMALQLWSAQNSLVPTAMSVMELVSGKLRPDDICEVTREGLSAKMDELEQVRAMLVSVILYGKKITKSRGEG